MGNFSRDTFDRLKHYVGVRLQQGVPIVDADWNEQEDIRKYELQAFLRWFVGNGVPQGNDGFRVEPLAGDNDFRIAAGRCLVEGWDVINESDLAYTAQPLFGDAALAADWGVDPLPALTTPGAGRQDTVYLDVWEREVDAQEDPDHLVNPLIGIETAVRLRREWVVRVAEGGAPPAAPEGHVHYELAVLERPAGVATIGAATITDRRRTGLGILPFSDVQQIVTDAFGAGYTLGNGGQPDLKVSLREAINALLRNELPTTPEVQLTTEAGFNYAFGSYALRDSGGAVWVVWGSDRTGTYNLWYNRYDPASGSWDGEAQLTTDAAASDDPDLAVLEDGNGDLWVVWSSYRGGNSDIYAKRWVRSTGTWAADERLTTDAGSDYDPAALVDQDGHLWVFWNSSRAGNQDIYWKRRDRNTGTWSADAPVTSDPGNDTYPTATVDRNGDLWVFWLSSRGGAYNLWYRRWSRASNNWAGADTQLTNDSTSEDYPAAVTDRDGNLWVFWGSYIAGTYDLWYRRRDVMSGTWSANTQLTTTPGYDYQPIPMVDAQGNVWVFWYGTVGTGQGAWYKRHSPAGGWGPSVQLAPASGEVLYFPTGVTDAEGDIWMFWTVVPPDFLGSTMRYKRLLVSI